MSDPELRAEDGMLPSKTPFIEVAVSALLKPAAVSYLRELRENIFKDPNYLAFHDQSVSLQIQHHLTKQGIHINQEVLELHLSKVVIEAISRLKGLEK